LTNIVIATSRTTDDQASHLLYDIPAAGMEGILALVCPRFGILWSTYLWEYGSTYPFPIKRAEKYSWVVDNLVVHCLFRWNVVPICKCFMCPDRLQNCRNRGRQTVPKFELVESQWLGIGSFSSAEI